MKVQVLEEAVSDLADGYRFYESQVEGLGDYFLDSLWSDINSLPSTVVFMSFITDITVCCPRDFLLLCTIELKMVRRVSAPSWIADETRSGHLKD